MTTNANINFISRDCRNTIHKDCYGIWQGLGFEFICDCKCHRKKEQQALAEVGAPVSNAVENKPSLKVKQDD